MCPCPNVEGLWVAESEEKSQNLEQKRYMQVYFSSQKKMPEVWYFPELDIFQVCFTMFLERNQ